MIVTAGTIVGKWEEKYVLDAVRNLSNPDKFAYYIDEFEKEFAKYIGVKYVLAVSNGTTALHLACLALELGKGDEVIMPDLAFVSAANAISYTGAKPVLVDVDPKTWTIDPEDVAYKMTNRIKAIMPVYMYGKKPDMEKLLEFGLPIIEDACPAVGTKDAGTYGIGCFSFQGAKTLAIGEGGMVTTDNEVWFKRMQKLANHAKVTADFYCSEIGYNYRMSNIQAALGLGQLEHIDELVNKKKQIYKWYGIDDQEFDDDSVPWMTSKLEINRDKLRIYLKEKNIDTRSVLPTISSYPMYFQKPQKNAGSISEFGLNLPSATYLTKKEIDYVKSCIEAYYKS